nr:GtrA family protein [Rothia sp. ZJ1223]
MRYVGVGVTGVIFELLILYIVKNVLDGDNKIAVTASYWLGIIFSFLLQKFFAFENKETATKVVGAQVLSYSLLLLVNYLFTLGFIALFAEMLGIYIARMVALMITTGWNFFVYKYFVFKKVK